ncbi:MAG: TIGR02186 family protein [Rhizobiales bacterium]|nr:TIGR02186 family protein [Hyphomicrobiales bacterium]MBA67498.1 TIGR02186 family protein [Hyphomicrobiales bacterium]|tara:strand:+ start:2566 stop:3396 length:831 start_codon:yes stop_codon:yes gene_type:complete
MTGRLSALLAICLLAPLLVLGPTGEARAQSDASEEGSGWTFPEQLDIGISTNEIAISPNFSGADITVFGAIAQADEFLLAIGSYDIIVALEGPRRPATVRRKERVAGIWVNRHSVRFEPIPASYSISSTRPLDSIAKQIVLSAHDVGIQNIRLVPTGQIGDGSMIGSFREAMLRIMQQSGLYQRDPSGVQFISQSLFRASVRLPANIPVGGHTVRAELYRNGQYVTQKTIQLRVVKTGLEQFTYNLAHQYSLIYGIIAVAFALFTGWLSSVIFRKD